MAASTWSTTDLASVTLSGGNLTATASAAGAGVRGKDPKRSGKYYIEYAIGIGNSNVFGFGTARSPLNINNQAGSAVVQVSAGGIFVFDQFGVQVAGNPSIGSTASATMCCAVDLDNKLVWFRVGAAGNWNGNATYSPGGGGGVNIAVTGMGSIIDTYPLACMAASGNTVTANFGGSAFTGAVPAGFTSGWDDSVTAFTGAMATQIGLEMWAQGTPQAQLTQATMEMWASVPAGNTQALLTQIALEQWASAGLGVTAQQARVLVMA